MLCHATEYPMACWLARKLAYQTRRPVLLVVSLDRARFEAWVQPHRLPERCVVMREYRPEHSLSDPMPAVTAAS